KRRGGARAAQGCAHLLAWARGVHDDAGRGHGRLFPRRADRLARLEGEARPTGSTISPGRTRVSSGSGRRSRHSKREERQMSVAANAGAEMLMSGPWQVDPAHSVVEFRVR